METTSKPVQTGTSAIIENAKARAIELGAPEEWFGHNLHLDGDNEFFHPCIGDECKGCYECDDEFRDADLDRWFATAENTAPTEKAKLPVWSYRRREADWDFVNERIAVGAELRNKKEVDVLIEEGITHVIDCRIEATEGWNPVTKRIIVHNREAELLEDTNIAYINPGFDDNGKHVPAATFRAGVEFALNALAQPGNKVMVHCAMGINRGPSMGYAVLRALGYESLDAEFAIRKARPIVGLRYMDDADKALDVLGYTD